MQRYRIAVGHNHKVKPGNIVGAIANEAGIDSQYIGRINIHDEYSLIDLPDGMPKEVFNHLKTVRVSGQPLKISRLGEKRSAAKSSATPKSAAPGRRLLSSKKKPDSRTG